MKNHFAAFIFFLLAALSAFSVTGCVSSTPVVQYPADTSIAVVYTHDDISNVTSSAVPESFQTQLDNSLSARNLTVIPVEFGGIQPIMESIRDTDRRMNALKSYAKNANFIVLAELSTEFYSALSGRYRWDVSAKMTIMDTNTHETLTQTVSLPAVLMYSHETGADAIESVKSELERRLDGLVDQFLKGLTGGGKTPPKPQEAPKPSPSDTTYAPRTADPPAADSDNAEAPLAGGASPASEAIYFIMIDRFFNAQTENDFGVDRTDPAGWHGGDLEGIRQKLPWLHDMGITKLWISPMFTSAPEKFFGNGAFHGYWTYDLNTIDRRFGTEDDLRRLALEAQKYGISLILDYVVNHVGYGSPLVTQKPQWFHPALTIEDWNDPQQLTDRQVHGLPDLNQDNPEVYNYVYSAAQKWLSVPNIAGFRLDAVKHVSIEFWKKFNTSLRAQFGNIMLLGEYFDGDPHKVNDIQKQGNFTQLFDFPLAFALRDVFCEGKSLANLAAIPANDIMYTSPNSMATFIDNHDLPRFISICHGNTSQMEQALKVLLSWRGIPSIYYGTETPLDGDREPDNRKDMQFEDARFYTLIKQALHLRSRYHVLYNGETSVLDYQTGYAAIGRENRSQQAILLISSSGGRYTLPQGDWKDLYSQSSVSGTLDLPPHHVRILVRPRQNTIIDKTIKEISIYVPDDGYQYAIAGSIPELGVWDPSRAPKTTGRTPIRLRLPAQMTVVYKPVRIGKDGSFAWADGDNRELFTSRDTAVQCKY